MNSETLSYLNSIVSLRVKGEEVVFASIKTTGTVVSAICRTPFLPDSEYELAWESDLTQSVAKVFTMGYELDVINESAQRGNLTGDCESAHATGVLTIRLTLCPISSLPTLESPEGETFCTFFITLLSTTPVEFDQMKGPIVPDIDQIESGMTHLGKKAPKGAKKVKPVKPVKQLKKTGKDGSVKVSKVKKEKVGKMKKERVIKVKTPKKEKFIDID